jgi:hypothetical protein
MNLGYSDNKIFGYDPDYIISLDFRSKEGKEIKQKTLKNSSYLKKKALEIKKLSLNSIRIGVKKKKKKKILRINKKCKKYLNYFQNKEEKLVNIQALVRGNIQRVQNTLRGVGLFKKQKSVNEVDFFTIEKIRNIDNKYFFSYKDNDSFIYSFDIRSLKRLFDSKNQKNPFNRKPFTEEMMNRYKQRISQMEKLKIDIEIVEEQCLDEKTIFRQKIISVFQKMDALGHYTDIKWFTKLKRNQLKDWYKYAEDIFNYRANLTSAMKKKIIPKNDAFPYSVDYIYSNNLSIKKLKSICINVMERFVSEGISKDDKYTGSLYMLTALTQVSQKAAESLYWLIQLP